MSEARRASFCSGSHDLWSPSGFKFGSDVMDESLSAIKSSQASRAGSGLENSAAGLVSYDNPCKGFDNYR